MAFEVGQQWTDMNGKTFTITSIGLDGDIGFSKTVGDGSENVLNDVASPSRFNRIVTNIERDNMLGNFESAQASQAPLDGVATESEPLALIFRANVGKDSRDAPFGEMPNQDNAFTELGGAFSGLQNIGPIGIIVIAAALFFILKR